MTAGRRECVGRADVYSTGHLFGSTVQPLVTTTSRSRGTPSLPALPPLPVNRCLSPGQGNSSASAAVPHRVQPQPGRAPARRRRAAPTRSASSSRSDCPGRGAAVPAAGRPAGTAWPPHPRSPPAPPAGPRADDKGGGRQPQQDHHVHRLVHRERHQGRPGGVHVRPRRPRRQRRQKRPHDRPGIGAPFGPPAVRHSHPCDTRSSHGGLRHSEEPHTSQRGGECLTYLLHPSLSEGPARLRP